MGIAHKSRSFLIQGVSDEIQFLAFVEQEGQNQPEIELNDAPVKSHRIES